MIAGAYRPYASALTIVLTILGVVPTIAVSLFASESHQLWLLAGAIFLLAIIWPIPVAVLHAYGGEPQIPPLPDRVREFCAVSYAESSDADMSELSRFAMLEFHETFPDDVDTGAVRNGSAIGLRLTDSTGKNIGFLDAYHFRNDVLELWRSGNLNEAMMSPDQFVPLNSIENPTTHTLKLAIGAIYIRRASSGADHHLAHVLIEAAKEYLNSLCGRFKAVTIYATIFTDQGRRWAVKEGFVPDTLGAIRGKDGGGHDVYHLDFVPRPTTPRNVLSTYGTHCEYRVQLRF